MTTGERIKWLRNDRGMTQTELGEKIGVKFAAIYKYENGIVVNLKRSTIDKLAQALQTTPSYLLGYTDDPYDYDLDRDGLLNEIPSAIFAHLRDIYGNDNAAIWNAYLNMQADAKKESIKIPANAIPYDPPTGMAPVLGSIPAGPPTIADGCIEGYEPIDRPHPEEYYWLRVQGDSMINARIFSGDLVLIHMQNYAENGQIAACRINGDEATLKRYREQDDSVILIPENPDYEPRIVSKQEFAIGYASIMGVVVESKRKF